MKLKHHMQHKMIQTKLNRRKQRTNSRMDELV